MQPENKPRFYYPELDGLRFIAFLLVFIHNASPILPNTFLKTFAEYSWFGVDLFFCLSAFLITKLLIAEHEQTGKINSRNFYIRRTLRIWPLYFFYIVMGTIIIASGDGQNINIPWHLAGLATFTFNFVYFALLPSPILIFVHLWSISYEEQFYAVIPWFIRKLSNLTQSAKLTWLILLFVFGTTIRAVFIYFHAHPATLYFLPITHFDSMLGGIALGLGLFDSILSKARASILWIVGIIFISAVFLLPNNDATGWRLMLTYPLLGIGMTSIILSTLRNDGLFVMSFIRNKIFVYLGKISYGLYVYHFGTLALSSLILTNLLKIPQESFTEFSTLLIAIALTLTILFSIISYSIIEKPFLKLKQRFSLINSHLV